MKPLNGQEEKEAIREKALKEHERLHRLFVEDRLSFERERRRMIDEVIKGARNEEQREGLRALQASWDKRMRGAGSKENRFVLAQSFFWDHFHEKWHPAIKRLNGLLNGPAKSERS